MKLLLTLSLTFITVGLFAQNKNESELSIILNKIISDSANNFAAFKGSFKTVQDIADSVYTSTITIPGTYENEISLSQNSSSYLTRLASEVTEKKAKSIIETWKKAVKKALGGEYKMDDYELKWLTGKPARGYIFKKQNISITVWYHDLSTAKNKNAAFCHLHICRAY